MKDKRAIMGFDSFPQNTPEEAERLPVVKIEFQPRDKRFKGTMSTEHLLLRNAEGELVGEGTLNISRPIKGEHTAYLNTINTKEALRGRGYGKSTYLELIQILKRQNIRLKSGFELSRGSAKIWDWLTAEKRARKTQEGVINEQTENEGYSSAEYEAL